VKNDAPDAAHRKIIQDLAHQCFGDTAPPPGGLDIDVDDDRLGPSSRSSAPMRGRGRIDLS